MALLTLLISIGVVTTALALVLGVASMAHGGEYDDKHSVQLMFARVASQGVTIVLLLLALYIAAT
ncbi:MAG: HIG1 domain-containing protein [Gammaproteobacteria bacterium]|nr:HIG1 domain-containing protein [Gammaproteobacteria bacterium]